VTGASTAAPAVLRAGRDRDQIGNGSLLCRLALRTVKSVEVAVLRQRTKQVTIAD